MTMSAKNNLRVEPRVSNMKETAHTNKHVFAFKLFIHVDFE